MANDYVERLRTVLDTFIGCSTSDGQILEGQTAQQLGYVAVKKGTVRGQRHYLWVSGKKSDWRILDKSGRVIRKPTKADREFWGI